MQFLKEYILALSMHFILKKAALLLLFISSFFYAKAQTNLSNLFGDHMVLQREISIPIWGTSEPGDQIIIELAGNRSSTVTDEKGKWILHLPKLEAGGPYSLLVFVNEHTHADFTFTDVYIGDVWLASGQSNMEMEVQQSMNAEFEIENANNPFIRWINIPHQKSNIALNNLADCSWKICDSTHVKEASAAAYFFARDLYPEINIPIGIIQSTWGGTPIESWISGEQLLSTPITKDIILQNDTITIEDFKQDSLDLIRFWEIVYEPQNNSNQIIPFMGFEDSDWPELTMPKTFKEWEMPFYEGMIWLRKEVIIPDDIQNLDFTINLGHPEMNYSLYFNGQQVCENIWNNNPNHQYKIPSEFVHNGTNIISVRMAVLWGGGGFNDPPEDMYIEGGGIRISLAGEWKYMKDLEPTIPSIKNYHQYPSYLFNAMINPIVPYGIKGFLWYQGENNTEQAYDYRSLFPLLISDWRIRWEQGYLPFLYVQLANYMKTKKMPSESSWALLREAQSLTLAQPNTGMATIIDIGETNNIHPENKQEVGRRLALLAQNMVYDIPIQAYGPMYKGFIKKEDAIIIHFSEIGSGLAIKGNNHLKGFSIAGSNQEFYWAKAVIQGEQVKVTCEQVKNPEALRYNWADNPDGNLINKDGLPATPFRTDIWSVKK